MVSLGILQHPKRYTDARQRRSVGIACPAAMPGHQYQYLVCSGCHLLFIFVYNHGICVNNLLPVLFGFENPGQDPHIG